MKPIALALALLWLVLPAGAAAQAPAPASGAVTLNTIRVLADATARVKPDLAQITLGLTTDRTTAAAASAENARRMQQIVAAMKKDVGAGGEVTTSGFSVSPRFGKEQPGGRVDIIGYT